MNLKELKKLDADDLLEYVGLQRRDSNDWIVPAISALGVGLLVGAGLGLLFAPKEGSELRRGLKDRLSRGEETAFNGSLGAQSQASTPKAV
jgi:hypothetical protein